jgi:hypothetical protein
MGNSFIEQQRDRTLLPAHNVDSSIYCRNVPERQLWHFDTPYNVFEPYNDT